jgi:predicted MFS family arabinose efflux permease
VTLLTTLFAFSGFLMVYTYAGLVLDRVTNGDERILEGMLLFWGVAGTVGNVLAGHLVDRFESRRIIDTALGLAIVNFCALPWTSSHPVSTAVALTIWGLRGWGLIVPQQHRLVHIAPKVAPISLALNNTATYLGLACSGVLGGIVILFLDLHYLSLVGAGLIAIAFILAESAHLYMARESQRDFARAKSAKLAPEF